MGSCDSLASLDGVPESRPPYPSAPARRLPSACTSSRDHVAGVEGVASARRAGQYSSWYWYVLYAWLGE
jgi:hypothetical protein